MVLEKTFKSPLDCKEIKPVNSKRNQPWIFIGRTDAETEAPMKLIQKADSLEKKNPDAGKSWEEEEKGVTQIRWLDSITDSMDTRLSQLWETVKDREAWSTAVRGITKSNMT